MKLFNFKKKVAKSENVTEEVLVVEAEISNKEIKFIDSKVIQEDIKLSFDKVLEEFNLDISKESKIEELNTKLDEFKYSNRTIYKKISLLKGLNLINTPSITRSLEKLNKDEDIIKTKINNIEKELRKSKELQNLIAKYNIEYPGYKFISDEVMIDIMHKYKLALGDAFMYSKEIPDKSLDIINNFSKEIKESENDLYLISKSLKHAFGNAEYKEFVTNKPKNDHYYRFYIIEEFKLSKFKIIAPISHFTIPYVQYNETRNFEMQNIPLFKLDSKTRKFVTNLEEIEEVNKKLREVLDPIACLEVKGGYIIMDAWDEEAEIPEIKNVNLN